MFNNCVGFIVETVICIAKPDGDETLQRMAYNEHKRKHEMTF